MLHATPTRRRQHSALSALLACLAAAATPAQDPPVPPGGFPVRLLEFAASSARGPVTWVDGVRTELDVYHPEHTAPPSGWPTVLLVHGGEGTRKNRAVRGRANRLAARGYLCIAYDVRGDGATLALNPPGFATDEDSKLRDMADAFRQVPGLLPAGVTMDGARLAVTGDSQGGRHSLRAAGWSGQPLTAPIAPVTHMPTVSAVAPRICPLDVLADAVPDPYLANAHAVTNIYPQLAPTDPMRAAILAEDWPLFRTLSDRGPTRNYTDQLRTTTVPIQIGWAWEDAKHALAPHLRMVPTASLGPRRVILSTSGHSSPQNRGEEAFTDDQIGAWFDRWLKGRANGVEDPSARLQVAWRGDDPLRHTDVDSDWAHARFAQWPPAAVTTRTLHLRGDGSLQSTPATTTETGFTLRHRIVTPGYGIEQFCLQDRRPGLVLTDIALDEHRFDAAPLPADLALAGSVTVRLPGVQASTAWQITAALESVAADGSSVQISSGTAAGPATAGSFDAVVHLDDVAFRASAGHHLRLVVRNVALHAPPSHRFIRWVPTFVDCDVAVPIDAAHAPTLELPAHDPFPASLSPRLAAGSASAPAGIVHPLHVEAGHQRGNQLYVVLMSGSGTSPGFTLPGAHVPLVLDAWTTLGAAGTPLRPFTAFGGLLDAAGEARPVFDVGTHPVAASLVGLRFAFAAGGTEPGGARIWATDAAELVVRP